MLHSDLTAPNQTLCSDVLQHVFSFLGFNLIDHVTTVEDVTPGRAARGPAVGFSRIRTNIRHSSDFPWLSSREHLFSQETVDLRSVQLVCKSWYEDFKAACLECDGLMTYKALQMRPQLATFYTESKFYCDFVKTTISEYEYQAAMLPSPYAALSVSAENGKLKRGGAARLLDMDWTRKPKERVLTKAPVLLGAEELLEDVHTISDGLNAVIAATNLESSQELYRGVSEALLADPKLLLPQAAATAFQANQGTSSYLSHSNCSLLSSKIFLECSNTLIQDFTTRSKDVLNSGNVTSMLRVHLNSAYPAAAVIAALEPIAHLMRRPNHEKPVKGTAAAINAKIAIGELCPLSSVASLLNPAGGGGLRDGFGSTLPPYDDSDALDFLDDPYGDDNVEDDEDDDGATVFSFHPLAPLSWAEINDVFEYLHDVLLDMAQKPKEFLSNPLYRERIEEIHLFHLRKSEPALTGQIAVPAISAMYQWWNDLVLTNRKIITLASKSDMTYEKSKTYAERLRRHQSNTRATMILNAEYLGLKDAPAAPFDPPRLLEEMQSISRLEYTRDEWQEWMSLLRDFTVTAPASSALICSHDLHSPKLKPPPLGLSGTTARRKTASITTAESSPTTIESASGSKKLVRKPSSTSSRLKRSAAKA